MESSFKTEHSALSIQHSARRIQLPVPKDRTRMVSTGRSPSRTLPQLTFRYVHDVVLKNKEVRSALARQTDHIFVVILDPALDDFSIHQLDADRLLLRSQLLQISGFFKGVFGRRIFAPATTLANRIRFSRSTKRHTCILHGREWQTGSGKYDYKCCWWR